MDEKAHVVRLSHTGLEAGARDETRPAFLLRVSAREAGNKLTNRDPYTTKFMMKNSGDKKMRPSVNCFLSAPCKSACFSEL